MRVHILLRRHLAEHHQGSVSIVSGTKWTNPGEATILTYLGQTLCNVVNVLALPADDESVQPGFGLHMVDDDAVCLVTENKSIETVLSV